MPVHLRFTFLGEDQIDRSLLGLADRARDLTPAWDVLEERFTGYEARWFSSQGDGTWPQLSKGYAEWKARHFPGKPILQREGELLASVTKPDIAVKEPSYAIFGTAVEYAQYHQKGAGRLPRRRVIDLDDEEKREWVRVVQRFLIEGEEGL